MKKIDFQKVEQRLRKCKNGKNINYSESSDNDNFTKPPCHDAQIEDKYDYNNDFDNNTITLTSSTTQTILETRTQFKP